MAELRAGVARVVINPPLGTYLIGYADRFGGAKGVRDDLTATALVFEDAGARAALVALDLLCLNEEVVARIRERVAASSDVPAEHVMLCCSHTHAGPIAWAEAGGKGARARTIERLVSKVAAAVREASDRRRPVRLLTGTGLAGIAVNRREPRRDGRIDIGRHDTGTVDRSLGIASFEDEEGLVASVVNYACHGTVLGPRNRRISADWPGAMRRDLEARTGAPCLFLQGATANLNPDHDWGDDDEGAVGRLGGAVANRAVEVLKRLEPVRSTPLRVARAEALLRIVPVLDERGRPLHYEQIAKRWIPLPRFLLRRLMEYSYPWKTNFRRLDDGAEALPLEIQALRAGDFAIIAHAAETFTEIGLSIKERSPFPHTAFAGYSNGCIGYLPTAEAHAEGGYEVELSPAAYRMSGTFHPDTAGEVTEASVSLLEDLV